MSSTKTMKFSFTKGHNTFSLYGGTFDIAPYSYAHIVEQSRPSGKGLRIELFTTKEEAERRHREDIRKLYINNNADVQADPTKQIYRTLSAATQRYLGFDRMRDYRFSRVDVPVYEIERTDTSVTIDVDLTSDVVQKLMRESIRRPNARGKTQIAMAAKTPASVAKVIKPIEVKAPVQAVASKVSLLTLPAGMTIADLKKMNFKIMIVDANDQPFAVDVK